MAVVIVWVAIWIRAVMRLDVVAVLIAVAIDVDISGCGLGACKEGREKDCCCDEFLHIPWIPEIRNESFDRVSPIIYFQEQPTAV